MRDIVYVGLYRFFKGLLWILPDTMTLSMTRGLASFAYAVSKKHRDIIDNNLDLAFNASLEKEEKKKIGLEAFTNLINTVFGILKRDGMSREEVLKNVIFENAEIIQEYQDNNKNFILITGHFGNWELLSQAIAIKFDLTLVGVGRELDSQAMNRLLKKNREQFNVEMVYKKGAMKGCIKSINQKKVVGILIDQAIGKNQSIDVEFFNHKATHTPLASILSRKFDLDLIPAFISTEDYINYRVKIYTPIKSIKTENQEEDLAILTQKQASVMEEVIRENPKQWFWMHKRWK